MDFATCLPSLDGPQTPAILSSGTFHDASYSKELTNWDLEYVQMSQGEIAGELKEVHVNGLHIFRENFRNVTLNQFGRAANGSFVFGFPLHASGAARFNGHAWDSEICVFRGEREFDAVIPPMDLLSMVIDRKLLARYAVETEHVDLEYWLAKQSLLIEDAAVSREVSWHMRDILTSCFDREVDLERQDMQEAVRNAVLEALTPLVMRHMDIKPAPWREISRPAVVRRARQYALDHIKEPLQVIDLCKAVGVSRRALQLSFQEVLGINPVAYLRMLRLGGARRMLLEATPHIQIKDVVASWGFWHLSRFSQEYRELFGELPSETLRQARQNA